MVIYRLVGKLDSSTLGPTFPIKDEEVNVYELGLRRSLINERRAVLPLICDMVRKAQRREKAQ